jgi:hypothetical protein
MALNGVSGRVWAGKKTTAGKQKLLLASGFFLPEC